jgi:pimeloyl-ACP methyl ester carboxylesterase
MKNLRKYGSPPFSLAILHGGPGAAGEMAPVAQRLSSRCGVLEPLQTANTIDGQVQELKLVLEMEGTIPITLIGWSWGAWLGFIFSAQYPSFVKKLILAGSGPFEEKFARNITKTRLSRLNEQERAEAFTLMKILADPTSADKDSLMTRLGKLITKADSFNLLPHDTGILECNYDIYLSVWRQAEKLRNSGQLLLLGEKIQCPVVALHGDFDPHPGEGVNGPLARILRDFKFILLKNCGHYPWLERDAKDKFFEILEEEV